MNFLKRIWERMLNLHSHPISRATEEAKRAAQVLARAKGEVMYQASLRAFWTGQVAELDPNIQWWEFAAAKQGEYDHREELELTRLRMAEARGKLEACQARLTSLREGSEP